MKTTKRGVPYHHFIGFSMVLECAAEAAFDIVGGEFLYISISLKCNNVIGVVSQLKISLDGCCYQVTKIMKKVAVILIEEKFC